MTKNTSLYCNSGAGDQLYNDDIKRNGLHYIHNFRWIADHFIYFSNKYWVKWASSCNLFAMIYSGRGIWRRLPRYWCGVRQPIYSIGVTNTLFHSCAIFSEMSWIFVWNFSKPNLNHKTFKSSQINLWLCCQHLVHMGDSLHANSQLDRAELSRGMANDVFGETTAFWIFSIYVFTLKLKMKKCKSSFTIVT